MNTIDLQLHCYDVRKTIKKEIETLNYVVNSVDLRHQAKDILEASIKHVADTKEMISEVNAIGCSVEEMIEKYAKDDDFDVTELTEEGYKELFEKNKVKPYFRLESEDMHVFPEVEANLAKLLEEEEKRLEGLEWVDVECFKYDPISMKEIVNPVLNKLMGCGHVYDEETLLKYFAGRNVIVCKVPGCLKAIVPRDLIKYPEYWQAEKLSNPTDNGRKRDNNN